MPVRATGGTVPHPTQHTPPLTITKFSKFRLRSSCSLMLRILGISSFTLHDAKGCAEEERGVGGGERGRRTRRTKQRHMFENSSQYPAALTPTRRHPLLKHSQLTLAPCSSPRSGRLSPARDAKRRSRRAPQPSPGAAQGRCPPRSPSTSCRRHRTIAVRHQTVRIREMCTWASPYRRAHARPTPEPGQRRPGRS